jgi:glycosyltransferase involved in cell wall biosynthesis
VLTFLGVRVVLDYRPALTARSGVGEYTHELVRALWTVFPPAGGDGLDLSLFSSSWRDRLRLGPELAGIDAVDCRVPVSVLNASWHRLGFPPVEWLTGDRCDVTHSMHPLIMPSRSAATVVTIHDLNFLTHPERTRAEVRRDYPALARAHAARADAVIAVSRFTAREVETHLAVPADKITICSPGAPPWPPRRTSPEDGGYLLFLGTLEPRKNIGALLDAYERLLERVTEPPPLVLAGAATDASRPWLDRLARPPLTGRVRAIGYVDPEMRRPLYEGARLLVQPSFEEGFGLSVLEAMTIGVPVVAADRGALPELVGDAGLLVDPEPEQLAAAISRLLEDDILAATCSAKGEMRASHYRWTDTARKVRTVYEHAVERRA